MLLPLPHPKERSHHPLTLLLLHPELLQEPLHELLLEACAGGSSEAAERDACSGHRAVATGRAALLLDHFPDEPAGVHAAIAGAKREVELAFVLPEGERPLHVLEEEEALRHLGHHVRDVDLAEIAH